MGFVIAFIAVGVVLAGVASLVLAAFGIAFKVIWSMGTLISMALGLVVLIVIKVVTAPVLLFSSRGTRP